jgi:hypothetical protein
MSFSGAGTGGLLHGFWQLQGWHGIHGTQTGQLQHGFGGGGGGGWQLQLPLQHDGAHLIQLKLFQLLL